MNLKYGWMKKGGHNDPPTGERPPKPQGMKPSHEKKGNNHPQLHQPQHYLFEKAGVAEKLDFTISKMTLNNNDTIVIEYPKVLSDSAKARLSKQVQDYFKEKGKDVGVIILEEGMDIEVINAEKTTSTM